MIRKRLHGESVDRYDMYKEYLTIPEKNRKTIKDALKYAKENFGRKIHYNNYSKIASEFEWVKYAKMSKELAIRDLEEKKADIELDTLRSTKNALETNEIIADLAKKYAEKHLKVKDVKKYLLNKDKTINVGRLLKITEGVLDGNQLIEKMKSGSTGNTTNIILPNIIGTLLTDQQRAELANVHRAGLIPDDITVDVEVTTIEEPKDVSSDG